MTHHLDIFMSGKNLGLNVLSKKLFDILSVFPIIVTTTTDQKFGVCQIF